MVSLKEEFTLKNFKFGYSPVKDFVSSPWFPVPVVISYRAIVIVYSLIFIPYSLATIPSLLNFPRFFFFLTYWCYDMLLLYYTVALIVTVVHYVKQVKGLKDHIIIKDEESGTPPPDETVWYHKLQWLLFDIASTMAIVVTGFYWTFEYKAGKIITWWSFSLHVMNSVFIILEHIITSMPRRLLHVIYPMLFASFYMGATVLYWGVIDVKPLYFKLDYSNYPGLAVGIACSGIFIGVPVSYLLLYCIYRARIYLVRKYIGKAE